ncbi:alpha/beta hydrolase [Streptococcus tangpeifui]|uniref:alpha/beta hydrolase n=1 Tax=Streptococcus tangpeifui TaxID=2709400 RepID=UPI0013EE3EA1|nr:MULTISPECIES: alpha/beta hydrolase [unclassified Streptococcus]
MKKHLKSLAFSLVALLLIVMTILGKAYVNEVTRHKTKLYNSQMIPTILVPGSDATQERFNGLLASLNERGQSHSILKLTVKKDASITYSGKLNSKDQHPFIVIAFENNQDGYANIKKQAEWLDLALTTLQDRYKFKRFNAIGHSNGGLNWTIFLEKYYSKEDFQIQTLLTIATPYNFEETNISNKTQMLKDLMAAKELIPENLTVYNLAGTTSYDGDKIVPFASVETGKYIFQKTAKHYTQVTVSGDEASHSDLPSNPEVIQYIAEKIVMERPDRLVKPDR